jgi:hypothetical protein
MCRRSVAMSSQDFYGVHWAQMNLQPAPCSAWHCPSERAFAASSVAASTKALRSRSIALKPKH